MQPEDPVPMAVDLREVSFPAWPTPAVAVEAFEETLARAEDRLERVEARLERSAAVVFLFRLACVPVVVALGAVLTLFALLLVTVFAPVTAVALVWFAARHDHAAALGRARISTLGA